MDASDGKQGRPGFEPPPWERDAFDELARKREAEEAKARWEAQARAASETADEAPEPEAPEPQPAAVPPAQVEPALPIAEEAPAPRVAAAEPPRAAEVDERQIAAMLIGLRSEEPQVLKQVRPAAGIASGLTGLTGIGIAAAGLWGASGAGGNTIGMSGALMTAALGAMFVVTAIWVWIRATRGKGS